MPKYFTSSNVKAASVILIPVLGALNPATLPGVAYLLWALHASAKNDETRAAKGEGGSNWNKKYQSYSEYLVSATWQHKREQVIARARGTCERAGCSREINEVHHLRYPQYPRTWGDEPIKWLKGLCREHHREIHENS